MRRREGRWEEDGEREEGRRRREGGRDDLSPSPSLSLSLPPSLHPSTPLPRREKGRKDEEKLVHVSIY